MNNNLSELTLSSSVEPQVFFLTGPTAVGKTAVAQWLAERFDFDILSADSMLVYRGMDIGTAKPRSDEQTRVRYWCIDLVSHHERFSVGNYLDAARQAIKSIVLNDRSLIIAGGTGLYIKSLTNGLTSQAPMHMAIRSQAEQLLREKGIGALQDWLKTKNSVLYELLADKKNPRRLIRALERAYSDEHKHKSGSAMDWKSGKASPHICGLVLPFDQLHARIESRVQNMYSAGLIEEVKRLLAQGFESAPTANQAIGYAEVVDYLKKRCSIEEAINKTIIRTRHLVKHQMTWFRHQANVDWLHIDISMPISEIAGKVMKYWKVHGPTPVAL